MVTIVIADPPIGMTLIASVDQSCLPWSSVKDLRNKLKSFLVSKAFLLDIFLDDTHIDNRLEQERQRDIV